VAESYSAIGRMVLVGLTVFFSLLLVSELPLIALKFKSFGFKGNEFRYLLIILSVLLFIFFQVLSIPFIILLYILISLINNLFKRAK
jgi:CDP-diacylglycerol--serine O-phosphatidyltransferase